MGFSFSTSILKPNISIFNKKKLPEKYLKHIFVSKKFDYNQILDATIEFKNIILKNNHKFLGYVIIKWNGNNKPMVLKKFYELEENVFVNYKDSKDRLPLDKLEFELSYLLKAIADKIKYNDEDIQILIWSRKEYGSEMDNIIWLEE